MSDRLFKGEEGLALRFFKQPELNGFHTERTGRKHYNTVLYVEVLAPGSKESIPVFPCERIYCDVAQIAEPERTQYYERFRAQIEAFKDETNDAATADGTPLTEWAGIEIGQAETFREGKVFTVEGLAMLPDSRFGQFGPGVRELVEKAKAFVAQQAGTADATAFANELASMRQDMETLRKSAQESADAQDAQFKELERLRAENAALKGAGPPVGPAAALTLTPTAPAKGGKAAAPATI